VRGDGVGYYAFARAPLIQHNLDFTEDYRHANESFRGPRLDENGQPKADFRTPTGHLDNHFTVGPPFSGLRFFSLTHAGVLLARALGFLRPSRRFLNSLPPHLGPRHRHLRFSRLATRFPSRTPIRPRALGAPRHHRHLVGQLAGRLHVLQSFLVARAFRFRRRSLPLVLA